MGKNIHPISSSCTLVSHSILDQYVQFGKERKGSDHGLFSGSEENKVNQYKNYEILKTMTTQIRNGNVNNCTTKFSAGPEKFQETTTINSNYKDAMVTMPLKE
jgi:hypothetical protein